MVVRIYGRRMFMWQAVDQEGEVLDVLVQKLRDKLAALKSQWELLRKQGLSPYEIVTDGLASYGAALETWAAARAIIPVDCVITTGPRIRIYRCGDESLLRSPFQEGP